MHLLMQLHCKFHLQIIQAI